MTIKSKFRLHVRKLILGSTAYSTFRDVTQNSFTLHVGPEKKFFLVHGFFLCQSPILRRTCIGLFMGRKDHEIILPFDNAETFQEMLVYLHLGSYYPKNKEWRKTSIELASVYIMAAKYELVGLKRIVVQYFADYQFHMVHPGILFKCAQIIYNATPDKDELFAEFFRDKVQIMFALEPPFSLCERDKQTILKLVSGGGKLAVDIFRAQALGFKAHRAWTIRDRMKNEINKLRAMLGIAPIPDNFLY